MTRKEAIKGSLDKWKRICNDGAGMGEVRMVCALCTKYNDDCGGTCPLYEMGRGCWQKGSPWGKTNSILRIKYGFLYGSIGTLSETDCCLQLADHCNEMRETLQKLYDAEE